MEKQPFILWFEEFGREEVKRVGGKCASLGEMVRIGIPVPPGFAVTTEAYDAFVRERGADKEIEEYLKKFPEGPQTLAEFEEVSQTLRQIIASKEMLEDIKGAVGQAYDALSQRCGVADLPVAVRSSGVAEDMPTASFAGQYESYLNVRGKDDLLDKVRLCWASMFSTRGISYRVKKGMGVLAGSISVAVMKMVSGRSAGVGFTVHPSTGDDARVVLEGNWGLGEAVVQGIVTPDTFVVNKENLVLEEERISKKLRQIALTHGGTEQQDIPPEKRCVACLTNEEAVKIAEYAKSAELHYGVPLDIEWVVDLDLPFPQNTFLVQARPVTAIPKKKTPAERLVDLILSRSYRR